MEFVKLRSLAKINLDLRVLQKRPDGFHELRTVFQTVSLADQIEIQFEPARKTRLTIDDPLAIPNNLILRAAQSVLDRMKIHAHVGFRLHKNIPMGAGLGGGSSNAAAVLLALPVLARRFLTLEILLELGVELGSDVPFFLTGGTSIGVGRGSEIYPAPDVPQSPILLVSPDLHVATPPAYAALGRKLTFNESSSNINSFQGFVHALDNQGVVAASALSANDFEPVVFRQYPQLKRIAGRLRRFSTGVRMSGSGSTIFALFDSVEERSSAVKHLKDDPALRGCRLIEESLVNRRAYQRMWRRMLREYLAPEISWPPRSRYAR
jgi:4-diphosphocytidyl-2-C-methyl-D-erythritol kinase